MVVNSVIKCSSNLNEKWKNIPLIWCQLMTQLKEKEEKKKVNFNLFFGFPFRSLPDSRTIHRLPMFKKTKPGAAVYLRLKF